MNKDYYIVDLIFRGVSHAAGVEIPSGKHLPWEKIERKSTRFDGGVTRMGAKSRKLLQPFISKSLGFLGHRLIRASEALASH